MESLKRIRKKIGEVFWTEKIILAIIRFLIHCWWNTRKKKKIKDE